MSKMSKIKKKASGKSQRAERRAQSVKHKVQSAAHPHSPLSVESQIAALEEQIALLRDVGRGTRDEQNPTPLTPHPSPRAVKIPAPEMRVTVLGSNAMRVTWEPIEHAYAYMIEWSDTPDFTHFGGANSVEAAITSITVDGMMPDSPYWFRAKALAHQTEGWLNSDFSDIIEFRTLSSPENNTSGQLQSWLNELQTGFQTVATLVPQLDNTELNSADRRRLNGSGVRRYGFIEKTADIAGDFPQIWPGLVEDTGTLHKLVEEIEVLRNLLIWFRFSSRVVQDLLLLAGDDAFRLAGAYYAAARDGARRKNPEAQKVYEMLKLFWRKRRRMTEEPTLPEIERDFRGVLHGTKNGIVSAQHESPHVSGGVHEVIDNVHSAKCRVKETPTP